MNNISARKELFVAGGQYHPCTNKPNLNINGSGKYRCPLWMRSDNVGLFDESGYVIDHVTHINVNKHNHVRDLRALCRSCHFIKMNLAINGWSDGVIQ